MNAVDWLIDKTSAALEPEHYGAFSTPDGKLGIIDPLCTTEATFFDVPKQAAKLIVLYDEESERESKLVLEYTAADVTGGAHLGDCPVDGGVTSPVTPTSLAALNAFKTTIDNPYSDYFERFDERGAEPWYAKLPDGTPMPYIHSGWGDGCYPVFSLTGKGGAPCAVYCDYLGCDETENWVMPPGVTMT